jgi:hypothetical protein
MTGTGDGRSLSWMTTVALSGEPTAEPALEEGVSTTVAQLGYPSIGVTVAVAEDRALGRHCGSPSNVW